MTRKVAFGRGIFLFLIMAAFLLPGAACKKKEQPTGRSSSDEVNPYASDSVFMEVKKKLDENPKDPDAWFHLADLYFRNAQYSEAADAYRKTVALKPDMGYAYVKMGTAYDRMNKPADAIRVLKEGTKYMPQYPVIYNNMGVAYGKLGKYPEEVASLKKALKLRPHYSSAAFNLGMTYLHMKNKKAAMQEYESLKKHDEGAAAELLKEIEKGPGTEAK